MQGEEKGMGYTLENTAHSQISFGYNELLQPMRKHGAITVNIL